MCAAEKGTLIRVFATAEGTKLQELRRGFDPACIYSVAFSRGPTPEWVAATSDKGTAHVFSLRQAGGGSGSGGSGGGGGAGQSGEGELASSPSRANPTSALSFVSVSLPAVWSRARPPLCCRRGTPLASRLLSPSCP